MLIAKLSEVVEDVLASDEFKSILARVLEKHLGSQLSTAKLDHLDPDKIRASADTVVEMGADANTTPEGLAWHFRQKLSRRPNSQESMEDLAAIFDELLKSGTSGQAILMLLKDRGRSAEPIWEFLKRITPATSKSQTIAARERALETRRKLAARG